MPELNLGSLMIKSTEGSTYIDVYTKNPLYGDWDYLTELCDTEEELQSVIDFLQATLDSAQKSETEEKP